MEGLRKEQGNTGACLHSSVYLLTFAYKLDFSEI